MKRTSSAVVLCVLVVNGVGLATAEQLWVIAEKTRRIWLVDTVTNTVSPSPIMIGDPDSDGTLDTPRGIAFSTTPTQRGTKALVAQGKLVTVVDVASRNVGPVTDVGALIGDPSLLLTGIATSVPRHFGTSSATRTFVFLLGSVAGIAGGPRSALWIALDQPRTIAGSVGTSSRWFGTISTGFSGGSVHVLPTADGLKRQRVWYTLIDSVSATPRVASVLLSQADSVTPTFSLSQFQQRTMSGTAPAPKAIHLGAPATAELPVMPWYSTGELENVQHGFSCSVGGRLTAAAVVGPGVNSYTVFATDVLNSQLLVIDPAKCAGAIRRPTGRNPISLTVLGRNHWDAVFTTNYDGDSLTRLNRDGSMNTIQLAPPGSTCAECPSESGVAFQSPCVVEQLAVSKSTSSLDLSWSDESCPADGYDVFCRCLDKDVDCPCSCVCDGSPPFGCECPGIDGVPFGAGASTTDLGLALLPPPGGGDPSEDGWIKLGSTNQLQLQFPGDQNADWQAAFSVDAASPPLP